MQEFTTLIEGPRGAGPITPYRKWTFFFARFFPIISIAIDWKKKKKINKFNSYQTNLPPRIVDFWSLILFYKEIEKRIWNITDLKYSFYLFFSFFFFTFDRFVFERVWSFCSMERNASNSCSIMPETTTMERIVAALATFDNRSTILVTRDEAPEFGSKSFNVPRWMFLGKLYLSGS